MGIEWYIMSGFPFDVIIRSWIECASSVVRACNLCWSLKMMELWFNSVIKKKKKNLVLNIINFIY